MSNVDIFFGIDFPWIKIYKYHILVLHLFFRPMINGCFKMCLFVFISNFSCLLYIPVNKWMNEWKTNAGDGLIQHHVCMMIICHNLWKKMSKTWVRKNWFCKKKYIILNNNNNDFHKTRVWYIHIYDHHDDDDDDDLCVYPCYVKTSHLYIFRNHKIKKKLCHTHTERKKTVYGIVLQFFFVCVVLCCFGLVWFVWFLSVFFFCKYTKWP